MGTRLVEQVPNCVKNPVEGPELWNSFCTRLENATDKHQNETTELDYICDEYFLNNIVNETRGILGISSGVFSKNMWNSYHDAGDVVARSTEEEEYNLGGKPIRNYVIVDIWTSFTLIIGIFFPSVTGWKNPVNPANNDTFLLTGIMAGSNRSGDLADAQKSIPIGTICAIATTGTVYLASVLFFAAVVDPLLLRDK